MLLYYRVYAIQLVSKLPSPWLKDTLAVCQPQGTNKCDHEAKAACGMEGKERLVQALALLAGIQC